LNKNTLAKKSPPKATPCSITQGSSIDLLPMVCDAAFTKQGQFMPSSHTPIVKPEMLREMKPDVVLVHPWNIVEEVADQHSYMREWGGQFVVAVSKIKTLEVNL
jgi:hypothetical protein